jgi:cell wall-associated NlpC family hydrolase
MSFGANFLSALPTPFHDVPYVYERFPGVVRTDDLDGGANCQLYAYEVLRHFGWEIPPLRASELWEDESATAAATEPWQPLDLVLFSRGDDAWGAHVGVYAGDEYVLHLCREVGVPVMWTIEEFQRREQYRVMRAKRPVRPLG